MRFGIVVALLAAQLCSAVGRVENPIYPLKQRQDEATTTSRFNLTELPFYRVSYSEDSSPKLLSRFMIALFETDGLLPFYPSLFNVEMALQDFVEAELNSAYAPFSRIQKVHAKVVSQKNTASTRNMRSLQMRGSELELELNVTFANEPSPEISDVDLTLKMAMENMVYFLTNLTRRAEGDPELENVHSAFRLEISDYSPAEKPTENNGSGADPIVNQAPDERTRTNLIVPLICAFCVATILVGFFVVRRQHTSRGGSGRDREFTGNDVGLNWDEESDIFSFETALLDTPHEKRVTARIGPISSSGVGMSGNVLFGDEEDGEKRSRGLYSDNESYQLTEIALRSPHGDSTMRSSSQHNLNHDTSDLFSTFPSEREKPSKTRKSRSMFSFFSSRISGKPKTMQDPNSKGGQSNLQLVSDAALAVEQCPREKVVTPSSGMSSLFTLSDEDEVQKGEDVSDEVMEIINGIESGYRSNWQDQDKKEDDIHGDSFRNANSRIGNEAENMSEDKELSSSAELLGLSVLGALPRDELESPKSVHSKPFDEESPRTHPKQFEDASQQIDNKTTNRLGVGGHTSNLYLIASESSGYRPKSPPSHLQRKSLSDSKVKRERESAFLRPTSHSDSKPKSAVLHDLKNVDSSGVKKNLSKDESGYHDWGVILRHVKSPVRSQNESSDLKEESNNNQKYLKDTQQEDRKLKRFEVLWESEEFNSAHKKGRRHTKSTLADGTTNYQSEAMDPQDWSVTTGEEGSLASTEVADVTPQKSGKKKKNVLSGFLSGLRRKDPESYLSMETPNATEQSPASTATDDQYAEIEAATNTQLISDLVWLEKKISSAKDTIVSSPDSEINSSKIRERHQQFEEDRRKSIGASQDDSLLEDSLSFRSGDQSQLHNGSSLDTTSDLMSPNIEKDPALKGLQTIVCRDCYAPPGKLKIVIHSTKDGPAIHTVKSGSALTGHIFPGDLIISVDDIDTRSYTAEQVMKMMTERARHERKITVLHFEEAEEL